MIRARPFAKCFVSALLLGTATSFASGPQMLRAPNPKIVILDAARPDLTLQAITSDKAQSRILDELRKVYVSAMGSDPLSRKFDKPIEIKAKINTRMGAAIKSMVEDIVNMRLDPAEILITIEGLQIESPEATLRFDEAVVRDQGIDFVAAARLKRTVAKVDKITIRFRSNQNTRSFLDTFFVELKGTSLRADRLDSLAADVKIRTEALPNGSLRVGVDSGALKIFDDLEADELAKELVFEPGEIRLPDGFGVQIGSAVLPHRPEGLRDIVHRRRAQIAKMMIDPLAKELRSAPEKIFRKGPPGITLPPVLEAELPCMGRLGIRLMRFGVVGGNQLHLAFGLVHPTYPKSSHGSEYYDQALDAAYEKIDQNRASVIMGLGYRAMAWGIRHGVEKCLQKKLPAGIGLGPKGVEVRLDETGQGLGVIALHALVNLPQSKIKHRKIIRPVIGSPTIEFPVKLEPDLDYRARTADAEPKLVLDLSKADLSEKILLDGYKSIPSNLRELRFKGLVRKGIAKELRKTLGKAILDIPVPFAKGEDLTFAELRSDGFGNLDLNLRLDPELDSGAKGFWTLFSEYLEPLFTKAAQRRADARQGRTAPPR